MSDVLPKCSFDWHWHWHWKVTRKLSNRLSSKVGDPCSSCFSLLFLFAPSTLHKSCDPLLSLTTSDLHLTKNLSNISLQFLQSLYINTFFFFLHSFGYNEDKFKLVLEYVYLSRQFSLIILNTVRSLKCSVGSLKHYKKYNI